MTGGRVYVRISSEMGMDRDAIERRLGKGAMVNVEQLDETGAGDISELLGGYAEQLRETGQTEEADRVLGLAGDAGDNFLMIVPEKVQADPSISTE
jgi:glutamate synthase (NADPH/NADH) large chain